MQAFFILALAYLLPYLPAMAFSFLIFLTGLFAQNRLQDNDKPFISSHRFLEFVFTCIGKTTTKQSRSVFCSGFSSPLCSSSMKRKRSLPCVLLPRRISSVMDEPRASASVADSAWMDLRIAKERWFTTSLGAHEVQLAELQKKVTNNHQANQANHVATIALRHELDQANQANHVATIALRHELELTRTSLQETKAELELTKTTLQEANANLQDTNALVAQLAADLPPGLNPRNLPPGPLKNMFDVLPRSHHQEGLPSSSSQAPPPAPPGLPSAAPPAAPPDASSQAPPPAAQTQLAVWHGHCEYCRRQWTQHAKYGDGSQIVSANSPECYWAHEFNQAQDSFSDDENPLDRFVQSLDSSYLLQSGEGNAKAKCVRNHTHLLQQFRLHGQWLVMRSKPNKHALVACKMCKGFATFEYESLYKIWNQPVLISQKSTEFLHWLRDSTGITLAQ